MFTRLVALAQCPSVVSRLEGSSPAWSSPSPPSASPLRSSLSRCTTSPCQRLFPATTLASTSRTCPSRTSSVATSPPTPRTSPPLVSLTSPPRSSCSTTPDRSPTATLLCSIATPRTLPASLPRSWRRLTDVLESPPRMLPSSSRQLPPRRLLARLPRQQRRPTRKSEILFWGNLGTLNLPLYLTCIRPGSSWLFLFFHP